MHLAFELFASMAKAKIQHVPYRGSPQAITDLIAKRVDFQVDTPQLLLPYLSDGRVRALAVTGPSPFFAQPNVPIVADSGLAGYSVTGWLGLAGPAGLPPEFVSKVNAEVKSILADPAVVARLRGLGAEMVPTTPEPSRRGSPPMSRNGKRWWQTRIYRECRDTNDRDEFQVWPRSPLGVAYC
jgi:tripartite-type tricarboxylate transporter receptor subunit TctC